MTKPRRTILYRGGKRPALPQKAMYANVRSPYGTVVCGVCGFVIGLRRDGSIRSHRVGSTSLNSALCGGSSSEPCDE